MLSRNFVTLAWLTFVLSSSISMTPWVTFQCVLIPKWVITLKLTDSRAANNRFYQLLLYSKFTVFHCPKARIYCVFSACPIRLYCLLYIVQSCFPTLVISIIKATPFRHNASPHFSPKKVPVRWSHGNIRG